MHLLPDRRKAPFVIYIPGMDGTKENGIDPTNNIFHARGFHVLGLDGPGQGSSNLRKIRVTEDNYASAGSAAIDYVLQRPELDADKVVLFGSSMGTYWGSQIAATDPRVRGCATVRACYGPKQHIFNQASPRFKQVFMYMAGIHDEAEFDRLAARMTLDAYAPRIQCPTLMVTGEYDPLCYLDETEAVYEAIPGPKELWVFENEAHSLRGMKAIASLNVYAFMLDWLNDALRRPNRSWPPAPRPDPEGGRRRVYAEWGVLSTAMTLDAERESVCQRQECRLCAGSQVRR